MWMMYLYKEQILAKQRLAKIRLLGGWGIKEHQSQYVILI
jgi:hypothetical protein